MAPNALHADFDTPGGKTYSITDLCDEFKVTPRALRFYEDEGLIAPRPSKPNPSRTRENENADLHRPRPRDALRAQPCARPRTLLQPAGLRECDARHGRSDPDRGRPLRRRGAGAVEPDRRRAWLRPPRGRVGFDAARLQGRLGPVRRRRLDDPFRTRGIWRAESAADRRHRRHRISALGQPGVRNV